MHLHDNVKQMVCIKCETIYEIQDFHRGCPNCLTEDEPASVTFNYHSFVINQTNIGMSKYQQMLPYKETLTLGEGDTPLISMGRLGTFLGVPNLFVKNEGQNPTGSHKDRTSPLVIARAQAVGAETVAIASSGNAGVSLATYAAYSGMECVVLTTDNVSPPWRQAMEQVGANIIYKKHPDERWSHLQQMVDKGVWYPATNFLLPPVGSNPFGVQGYKTVAYELIEQCEEMPDFVVIPVARGDLLWGVWRGFQESFDAGIISKVPKLVAVEPFARLEKVLAGHLYTEIFPGEADLAPSISGDTVTYQAVQAIKRSEGYVETVDQVHVPELRRLLGSYGIYAEGSAALALGGLKQLIEKKVISETDRVVLVITSNGYKDLLS